MKAFSKGDKVIVVNTDDIWEGKTGKVLSQSQDEIITKDDRDLTEVTVAIDFNDKPIVQIFNRDNLELYNLNETYLKEYLDMDNVQDFISYFIGKKVIFNGFDYDEIYHTYETSDGNFTYDQNDLDDINRYKDHEGQEARIIDCVIADGFEAYDTVKNNFDNCYWSIEFEDGVIFEDISGYCLTVLDDNKLNESLEVSALDEFEIKKEDDDFIHDYVYFVDIHNREIPTWYFIGKIAAAENLTEDAVLQKALELKYKVYNIKGENTDKLIILAPKCKLDDIYTDYINYIPGKVSVLEVA